MSAAGYILAAIGGAVVTGIGCAVYAAEVSPATPAVQSAGIVLTPGTIAGQSIPTNGSITLAAPTGGSINSITVRGQPVSLSAGTTSYALTVTMSETATIAWTDASGAAQTSTVVLTAT